MHSYRVTIDIPNAPNISVVIDAHSVDEARRIAHAQYPQGTVLYIVPEG